MTEDVQKTCSLLDHYQCLKDAPVEVTKSILWVSVYEGEVRAPHAVTRDSVEVLQCPELLQAA